MRFAMMVTSVDGGGGAPAGPLGPAHGQGDGLVLNALQAFALTALLLLLLFLLNVLSVVGIC